MNLNLFFPARTPVGELMCANFTVLLDTNLEGDEQFSIEAHVAFLSPFVTTVTIRDGIELYSSHGQLLSC